MSDDEKKNKLINYLIDIQHELNLNSRTLTSYLVEISYSIIELKYVGNQSVEAVLLNELNKCIQRKYTKEK